MIGIFEDLEQILEEQRLPGQAEVAVLLCRTRGALMQLVATVPDFVAGSGPIDEVIDRARHLVSTAPADGPIGPRVLLRRMTSTVVDLPDEMQPIP
ncbi:DUF6415 family natural product biosynthesis protein [Streptomyces sp. NPDC058770]|uniref:DUF6415 family natural product biosynthesis protein n=1 Tax=unclassified Streptomyces TaxID=2593676 RepID=UPI0036BFA84A